MKLLESFRRPQLERKHLYWAGTAGAVGLMLFAWLHGFGTSAPVSSDRLVPLATPAARTSEHVPYTPTASATPEGEGSVLYPYTGIRYVRTKPPDGDVNWPFCLSIPHGGTLFGATMSLGESPTDLTDVDHVRVYPNSRFGRTQPEEFDSTSGVPSVIGGIRATELWADTIVCGK